MCVAGSLATSHHHSRALRSEDRARARGLQHAARRRPPRARHASSATRSPRCARLDGLEIELYEFAPGARALARAARRPAPPLRRPVDAQPPARPRAVRRRARPLRPHRLAGARGSRPRARADRARHRHASPAHAPGDPRGAAADRPPGRRLELARAGTARRARASEGAGAALRRRPRALPPDPPRAGARASWDSTPSGPTCCSPPTRLAPRSATTWRSRSRARPMSSCSRSAASTPPARPAVGQRRQRRAVPSEREGFGLAVLEALACDVPVLATPVGIHPEALRGRRGDAVRAVRARPLAGGARSPTCSAADPRVQGRARAEPFSGPRMAERVADAWRAALERDRSRREPIAQRHATVKRVLSSG